MSPREKHIPDDAQRTSVSLTAEDRGAIHWISEVRRAKKDKRTTTNDILVDALWHYLENLHGKNREQIRAMLPVVAKDERPRNKVTEIPKTKR